MASTANATSDANVHVDVYRNITKWIDPCETLFKNAFAVMGAHSFDAARLIAAVQRCSRRHARCRRTVGSVSSLQRRRVS